MEILSLLSCTVWSLGLWYFVYSMAKLEKQKFNGEIKIQIPDPIICPECHGSMVVKGLDDKYYLKCTECQNEIR